MKFFEPIILGIDKLLRLFNKTLEALHIKPLFVLVLRVVLRVVLWAIHLVYFRLTVHGHHNIPKSGGVILAANHQSYLDPPLAGIGCWRRVNFVSKKENHDTPILGPLIELGDSYPIARGGDDDALSFFAKLLKKGEVVAIFPEGTIPAEEDKLRSDVEAETGLLRGKTGAIRLALKAKVPIVPLGISGSGRALCPEAVPRGEKFPLPKPTKITLRYGKPLYLTQDYDAPITRELLRTHTNTLMKKISEVVDHSMNYLPQSVPVTQQAFESLRIYERQGQPEPKQTKSA